MRHRVKKIARLGRQADHRKLLLRNLATSLFLSGRIQTTEAKARAVEPYVSRLIANLQGKSQQVAIRLLKAELFDENAMKKAMEMVAKKYATQKSGFIRVVRLGVRPGDASMKVLVELI